MPDTHQMPLLNLAGLIGLGWALFATVMLGAWLLWRRSGNAGFVDSIWSFGVGAVGILGALAPVSSDGPAVRQLCVALVVAIWSGRLGFFILRRSRAKGDDPRYAALIRQWGDDAPRQMFVFLQIQALVSVPLFAAIMAGAHNPSAQLGLADGLAVVVALIAIAGEGVADEQMRRFVAKAKAGSVCNVGLWRYSRHPNYFFEFVLWFAFPLFALSGLHQPELALIALAGPACMYWLLVHVSGVPPLEQHMLATRPEAYLAYQARTSVFFPKPEKMPKGLVIKS